MAKKRKKEYYVVVRGRQPGIYRTWGGVGGAAEQVQGFAGARYKGFYTRQEAREWLAQFDAPALMAALSEGAEGAVGAPQRDAAQAALDAGKIVIHTDGGAIDNPGPGGYGAVLRYGEHRRELSGGFRRTTNNRMELLACIEALKTLRPGYDVELYSDSQYVVNGLTRGWARSWRANGWYRRGGEPAENADLWAELLTLYEQHDVAVHWVRGHAGNAENERCDALARAAALQPDLSPDLAYEQGETTADAMANGLE